MNGIRYTEEYFPLPVCDGSDPLPWTCGCRLTEPLSALELRTLDS